MNATPERTILLLGTNIKPEMHLKAAIRRLRDEVPVAGISTVYQSKPVGLEDQSDFLNVAVELLTDRSPLEVRRLCKSIEDELGRDRSGPEDGPRKIDLDLVLYGTDVIKNDQLVIPDPDLLEHAHVAVPIAELAPDLPHPITQDPIRDIAKSMPDRDQLTPRPDVLTGSRLN